MIVINIANDYTDTPGGRYVWQGPFSGEDFRDTMLLPAFRRGSEPVQVVLDGTFGYPPSFIEEAFGGLARILTIDEVMRRLRLVSEDDDKLIGRIHHDIRKFGK